MLSNFSPSHPSIFTSQTKCPISYFFLIFSEMSLVPLRLKLQNDAIIFRTTNGDRKREDIVYTVELRWHGNCIGAEQKSGVGRSVPDPSSSGRGHRAVQGHFPGFDAAAAPASAAELGERPARCLSSCRG